MSGNARQIAYWNEVAGPKWVKIQGAMEARLRAVEDLLLERAAPALGECVLEIGCGTGTTTARLADLVGANGRVTAVDVAKPMLAAACGRLANRLNVELIEADAATMALEPSYDLVTSRFGVMFFEEPAAAFANLRAGLKPSGRLACVAWAPIARNPHWSVPLDVAVQRLGPPKPRRPHAPGPLAFDDSEYVAAILAEAGFTDIEVRAETVPLLGKSLDDEADVAAFMGPSGALLDEKQADPATRAELRAAFRAALSTYADSSARVQATIHLITARHS